MTRERFIGCAVTSLALLCSTHARAHFKLLEPTSWLNEDELGAPQKGSPCGPGNTQPFLGDDVQPIPASDAVTTFRAGETITVRWEETVYHPGYFRIALARTRAADATNADLPDPPLTDPVGCNYDRAAVQTVPHDDVLADGLFMAEPISAENRSLMQEVTLPDEPCDRCTLQVVQVMEGHGASSCFYFHCAEIEILPADDGSAGASDAGGGGAPDAGAAGAGSGSRSDSGAGCSVVHPGPRRGASARGYLLAVVLLLGRRRRPRQTPPSSPTRSPQTQPVVSQLQLPPGPFS